MERFILCSRLGIRCTTISWLSSLGVDNSQNKQKISLITMGLQQAYTSFHIYIYPWMIIFNISAVRVTAHPGALFIFLLQATFLTKHDNVVVVLLYNQLHKEGF